MARLVLWIAPLAVVACSLANSPDDPVDPDEGSGGTTTTSTTTSTGASSACGDGMLGGSESCDDGNDASDDGCDGSCAIEGSCAMPQPIVMTAQGAVLTGGVTSALGGVSQVDAASCGGMRAGAGSDRIYEVEVGETGSMRVIASGNLELVVRILGMPCDVGSELPDGCAQGANNVELSRGVTPGTYYLVVDSASADTQPFVLTVELAPPANCMDIALAGLPDGPYTVEGPKDVYCAGGTTYEAFGFGPYNVPFANFQLLGIADFGDVGLQNAFIWYYNTFGGLQNLSPGFNSGNCCVRLAGAASYLNFGDAGEPGRVYPANQNCTHNCSQGYVDAFMRFNLSSAMCQTMLMPNYFQMFPPIATGGCTDSSNPGFFVFRY